MKSQIEKLNTIAKKKKRIIIGLMSGTSLDGLDVALCEISGSGYNTSVKLLKFISKRYTPAFVKDIRKVFSKEVIRLQDLCILNDYIGTKHAAIINECLEIWKYKKDDIDLIASHGQTVYHAPKTFHRNKQYGNATLQIGDGDQIAVKTGIITISDFRQKHIAAGGEGAPLAAYGDALIFREKSADVILLNIGGVSNFTFLGKDGKYFSTDIGPGNNLMDAWMRKNFSSFSFDRDSFIAKKGKVIPSLLQTLKDEKFFKLPFPKTTGPELFNLQYIEKAIEKAGITKPDINDVMATLNLMTAEIISEGMNKAIRKNNETRIYVSGGGYNNPLLMEHIRSKTKCHNIVSTAEKNIDPDAKEAILFALLANETVAGANDVFGAGDMGFPAVSMGKISLPH